MNLDQLEQFSKNAIKFPLIEAMEKYQINTPLRQAHFLSQVGHESNDFRNVKENLNYKVESLLSLFGRHRISEADARRYGRTPTQSANQEAIANCIYGGEWGAKNLGNTSPGDGAKYIGRGLIQVTGKSNYANFSARYYGDTRLIITPELLELPLLAAMSAASYWYEKNLNSLADKDDVRAIRKVVNGGVIGLDQVKISLTKIKKILEI